MRIFGQLIRRDLLVFRKEYPGKFLDVLITFATWVFALGYFVPQKGAGDFGVFIMVGAIASFGIFEIIGKASLLNTDIKTDRTVSYLLLLPIRTRSVFFYMTTSWAIQSFLIALPLFIVGKLIFWDQFDLTHITWYQLILALIVVNTFFGFFSLWLASVKVTDINRLYFRIINPLFLLGCYFFTWKEAYAFSEPFGYAVLLAPFTYVMEIMRTAIIGQEGYLPFWVNIGALLFFIFLSGWFGIRRLKKQLDCL